MTNELDDEWIIIPPNHRSRISIPFQEIYALYPNNHSLVKQCDIDWPRQRVVCYSSNCFQRLRSMEDVTIPFSKAILTATTQAIMALVITKMHSSQIIGELSEEEKKQYKNKNLVGLVVTPDFQIRMLYSKVLRFVDCTENGDVKTRGIFQIEVFLDESNKLADYWVRYFS